MIHYHGTPLTPRSVLHQMAGKNFCVSFADTRDADTCLQIGQSVLFDNGAFTAHTQGKALDIDGYYAWLEPRLGHPHWSVIPDAIGEDEVHQRRLVGTWPFDKFLGAPVWHIDLSIDHLLRLAEEWPRICFGSAGRYWQLGSPEWCRRVDQAFNALAKRHQTMPWIHMLRGLNMAGDRWPFASADSVNIARNYKDTNTDPERMARRIDAIQCPVKWIPSPKQEALFA